MNKTIDSVSVLYTDKFDYDTSPLTQITSDPHILQLPVFRRQFRANTREVVFRRQGGIKNLAIGNGARRESTETAVSPFQHLVDQYIKFGNPPEIYTNREP